MGLTIRNITMDDRAAIFGWVEALGWNPGEKDGECLLATDPDGMFMAERDGVAVGCATAIAYDEHFGFVGQLPCWRSIGMSSRIWAYGTEQWMPCPPRRNSLLIWDVCRSIAIGGLKGCCRSASQPGR